MGVRFACHACGRRLNIKQELAGRRGRCPACGVWFRIPPADAATSQPVDLSQDSAEAVAATNGTVAAPERAAAGVSGAGERSAAKPPAPPAEDPLRWIDADPAAQWYVRPRLGGQYGPASGPLLRQWIAQQRVAADSLLWRNGWPQWREARDVLPDYFSAAAAAAAAGPAAPPPSAAGPPASPPTTMAGAPPTTAAAQPTAAAASPPAKRTTPVASAATVPITAARQPEAPGQVRRKRTSRRTMTIGLLVAASVLLLLALAVVLVMQPPAVEV